MASSAAAFRLWWEQGSETPYLHLFTLFVAQTSLNELKFRVREYIDGIVVIGKPEIKSTMTATL
jgi:hypothetical protein